MVPGHRRGLGAHFGAGAQSHRDAIRADLTRELNQNDPLLRDLAAPPASNEWSISISHAPGFGGWLAVPKPRRVGFDLELCARVRAEIIQRMCSAEEIKAAGHSALLWSAKEALFKALAGAQPATLSKLRIEAWRSVGPLVHFTSADGVHGCAQVAGDFAAAWCTFEASVSS